MKHKSNLKIKISIWYIGTNLQENKVKIEKKWLKQGKEK
jgi:hypothetical protein